MATYHNGSLNNSSEGETLRMTLRRAWNGPAASGKINGVTVTPAATPFRIVNNAGDFLSRQNYSSGGPNQVNSIKQSISGSWRTSAGRVRATDDGTGVPSASCNPKYVYDSSNYIAYRKQRAVNKNYRDISSGGDESNASYSAILRVRR
jgi:hypothetical protein